ncbi:hypothetical protein ISCGN_001861 [Ixodes scapularis]
MDSNLGSDTSDPARASSRIYVGNLKKHILREDLEKLFIKYGTIQGISLHKGGFGFVQFREEEEAQAAVKGEGGIFFKGCLLQLKVCSAQESRRPLRANSRERESRDYHQDHPDRRPAMSMGRERSPIRRDFDEREFKRDDRSPMGKPFDRSPPRRGDDGFPPPDRRFGREESRYGRDAHPPPAPYGRDDFGRGGPPGGPPRDSYGGRYGRDESKAGAAWEELDVIWFLQGNSMDSNLGSDTSDPARASSRIYVGNLKKHILREDLEKLFIKYGTIQGISLHKGGFGFVQFREEEEAQAAVKGEGGIFFKGCLLQLKVCSAQESRRPLRANSRERESRDYHQDHPDRRPAMSMGRERSPIRRDFDEREFKRDDRSPMGKPFDRSPPRRGDDGFPPPDRRFGREESRYGRDAHPPPAPYGRDDFGRGGPPGGPPRDSYGGRYGRDERYPGRDDRGYGRDEPPPRPFPRGDPRGDPRADLRGDPRGDSRGEGNGRYPRDGYWGGRDDYGGHRGREEPPPGPGGYMRDELPLRPPRIEPPPPPAFRPEAAALRKPNDCEIIVLRRQNRSYAEMVERRLKNLGMQVDLLFLKDEALLSRALEDLTLRGTLFAVVVTDQHELHGSVTVNILYGVPQACLDLFYLFTWLMWLWNM